MSSDTFTTAIFLITAVIAAGVLVSAIFPVIYQMSGTFSSASHTADQQLRTDIKIVLAVANGTTEDTRYARVWIKNTGSEQVAVADIKRSDVICGNSGDFGRMSFVEPGNSLSNGQWTYTLSNLNSNNFWDPGETLEIDVRAQTLQIDGSPNYFQFALPNGIWRSTQFTSNAP
jgi:archaeal flagellar protein FlaG